jgi:uncharacterized Zn finger protein (UPF0148 family)
MSDLNRFCPVCESNTSAIGLAYKEGDPCPYCGTTEETAKLIIAAQDRLADQKLVDELIAANKTIAALRAELDQMSRFRSAIRSVMSAIRDEA